MECSLSCLLKNSQKSFEARHFFELYKSNVDINDYFYDSFGIDYDFVVGNVPQDKFVFSILKCAYKNDYFIRYWFYKKELLNKQAVSFFEMPINESRVDVVSVDNKSVAYEIKTRFDTLKRLKKQLFDYSLCFEYVYVICPHENANKIIKCVDDYIGVIVYNDRSDNTSFNVIKKASLSPNLNLETMLSLMLSEELKKYFGTNDKRIIISNYTSSQIVNSYKKSLKVRFKNKMEVIKSKLDSLL